MDKLPEEILGFIFKKYLTIEEILRCSLVNKKFNFIVKNLKLDSLFIDNNHPRFEKWFYTNEPVNVLHRLSILNNSLNDGSEVEDENENDGDDESDDDKNGGLTNTMKANRQYELNSIDFLFGRQLFTNIKQLYISSFWLEFKSNIGQLISNFKHLKELSIICSTIKDEKECTFDLPNLVNLSIESFYLFDLKSSVIFNCPKLENISITALHPNQIDVEKIIFKNCDNVVFFHCSEPWKNIIKEFKNLKKLICDDLFMYDQATIFELEKLEEFHFFTRYKNDLKNLKDQKMRNSKKDLKLFFLGLDYSQEDCIPDDIFELLTGSMDGSENNSLDITTIKFYGKYHEKLSYLPNFSSLNYSCLEEYFNDNVPERLKDKINDINSVQITDEIKYPDQLKEFLRKIKRLDHLSFTGYSSEQKLFDSILEIIKSINSLDVFSGKELNFDSIFKLEKIHYFQTDQILDLNFLKELINAHKRLSLEMLNFKIKNQCNTIIIYFDKKIEINFYIENDDERESFECNEPEEAISKLEELFGDKV